MQVPSSNFDRLGIQYSVVSDFDHYPGSLQFQLHQSKDSLSADTALNVAMEKSKPDCSGMLSVHHYRKSLCQDDESCSYDGHAEQALKRSNDAFDLNQVPSVSATSSLPPLSPSYSLSIASQRSEEQECLDSFLCPRAPTPQMAHSEFPIRRRVSNRLNTFRDRLRKPSLTREPSFLSSHTKTHSDSVLLDMKQPKATMVHQGTSFEILNPHESLNFARIVSYIEDVDVDEFSRASSDYKRESFLSASTISTKVLKAEEETPSDGVPEDKIDNGALETSGDNGTNNEESQAHSNLVGEPPHTPMPSISERLEGSEEGSPAATHGYRSKTPASSLGEPGPCEEDGVVINEPDQVPSNKPEQKKHVPQRFYPSEAWLLSMHDEQPAGFRAENEARPVIHHRIPARTREKPKRERTLSRLRGIIRLPFLRRKQDSTGC